MKVKYMSNECMQNAAWWIDGSRQIGPLANWAPSDFCGKLGPGRLGPGKLGPGRLGPGKLGPRQIGPLKILVAANWAPENLLVANWAPANWAPANRAPADWAPWQQIGPRQINYMLPKGLQNYTKFASEWKAFPYGSPTQMQTLFGHCPWTKPCYLAVAQYYETCVDCLNPHFVCQLRLTIALLNRKFK